ncbi:MAG: phasin family protein [Micavibrio aeruginosavorus]|uniref:Phasin family protein n=1 Tax=Micavibrio aeruginosavorus TaxID=349221 RepID=A0A7T5R1B7_9BACT|nr:MAG: phasin family protein [Micavibrio aeruginosavorus]
MYNFDLTTSILPQNIAKLMTASLFSPLGGYPKGLPVSPATLLEIHRQGLVAWSKAQKAAFSGLQTVVRQQNDILSGMLEWQSAMLGVMMQEGTPEEKISRQASLTQAHYQNSLRDMRQVQDTIASTLRQASDVLHQSTLQALRFENTATGGPILSATPANSDTPSADQKTIAA